MQTLTDDALDLILSSLPLGTVSKVVALAPRFFMPASKAKLSFAVACGRKLGSRWMLRLDNAEVETDDEEETRKAKDRWKRAIDDPNATWRQIPATMVPQMQGIIPFPHDPPGKRRKRRAAREGDSGCLGWRCCLAKNHMSLWCNINEDRAETEQWVPVQDRLFLTRRSGGRKKDGSSSEMCGTSLDIQVLALLPFWRPLCHDPCRKSYNPSNNSNKVREFISFLQIDTSDRMYGLLAENLSVDTGNLLSVMAVSGLPISALLHPASCLVDAGAVTGGLHILFSQRKTDRDSDLMYRWWKLWQRVAERNLENSLSRVDRIMQHRLRPKFHRHQIRNELASYPLPWRRLGYKHLLGEDVPCFEDLEQAFLACVALDVNNTFLQRAMDVLANDPGGLYRILGEAILNECQIGAINKRSPRTEFLRAWILIGSGENHPWLLDLPLSELDDETPVEVLCRSGIDPAQILESVRLLAEFGDCGGWEYHDGSYDFPGDSFEAAKEDVMSLALRITPDQEPARTSWLNAWARVASNRQNKGSSKSRVPSAQTLSDWECGMWEFESDAEDASSDSDI